MNFTLIAVVAVALAFDFTNGFHDAANAIATSVSTRAVSPRLAVLASAALNFAGAFLSLKVATTVGSGIVADSALSSVTLKVVLAGLIGAIAWNLLTWRLGLPSSSSHALIGGLVGAVIAATGFHAIQWSGLWDKVAVPALWAPALALPSAALVMFLLLLIIRKRAPGKVNRVFRRLQLVSAGFVALAHGTNDAQKTMGVIAFALVVAHPTENFHVPGWVIISAAIAMAAGTYAGGWRIVRTLGQRIAKLEPPQGFAAETAAASVLWLTAHFGFPVSTTHVVSSSVLGSGASSRFSAVRWGIAGNIVVAWLLTLPAAALVGAGMEMVTRLPGGVAWALVLAVALFASVVLSRRPRLRPAAAAASAPA
jgi:PiT family inorganic phosphate transporter